MVVIKGDTIRLDEFVYLYRLKESKEYGYYELDQSSFILPILEIQAFFLCLGMDGRLFLITSRVKFLGCFVIRRPQV